MVMRELWKHIPEGTKHLGDAISITALLGSLAEMLPHVAALLTIVWTALRIYESETVQGWLTKRRNP